MGSKYARDDRKQKRQEWAARQQAATPGAMLALEGRRFQKCEFRTVCDPAMVAGEDKIPDGDLGDYTPQISKGSDRQRLAKALGRRVDLAVSNDVGRRHDAVRAKIGDGGTGYLLDPSCTGLIRGKRETYQFRTLQGSNDISSVKPSFDTHVADAEQYMAIECGTEAARRRRSELQSSRAKRRQKAREAGRYNPFIVR